MEDSLRYLHENIQSNCKRDECDAAILKNVSDAANFDVLLFYTNVATALFCATINLIYKHSSIIFVVITSILILYIIYKSYWNPVLIVKELTDKGFDHIPRGPHREVLIRRAQEAKKVGSKVPPPYPNGWFAVAESRDLKVGGVAAADILGQNLCVYRGEDGVARCVDAYCPHLGANLAVGGAVSGSCIQCPFHKWQFGADGRCVSVPDVDTAPKGVSIRTWRTREADGAVWVWHDAEGREPLWQIQDAEQLATWGYRGRNEFIVSCHIQDIPENGADVAHLNAVHTPSLLTNLGEKYPLLGNLIGRHVWTGQWSRNEDHTAKAKITHKYQCGKLELFHMEVEGTQIGPGSVRLLIRTAMGPILVCQSVTPIGPLLQRVIHRHYSPVYNAPIAAFFVYGESVMFERDVAIWNSKRYLQSPTYVAPDRSIRAFRSWFTQFNSPNSVTMREARDTLEW